MPRDPVDNHPNWAGDAALRAPIELAGRDVRLVPLLEAHTVPLFAEAGDPEIWRFLSRNIPAGIEDNEESLHQWILRVLRDQAEGMALAFTILQGPGGDSPVGMTRFMEIHREHRRVEIGGTWIARRLWGTTVNLEAKYLLLCHAFDTEGFLRVELKTDLRNIRSQKAMEKIGATREGVLRRHMTTRDGYQRDSVYYSIIAEEWPGVKERLEQRLTKP